MAFLSSFYPQPVVKGTTEGTFAEGDDARIVGAAQKSANLSDLASASTARANLDLEVGVDVAAFNDSRITGAATKAWVAGVNKTFYLAPRTDGVSGSGTQVDPYDVSTPQKWIDIISTLPNYCTIRLLGGQYNVRASWTGAGGNKFWPDGCSVIGDGMHSTVLTVTEVPAEWTYGAYGVIEILGYRQGNIGNPYLTTPRQEGCVVSDLTIDCNWQTFRAHGRKCGAINIDGNDHCAVKRCRVINFGGCLSSLSEAFPVSVNGENGLVEECVIEQPVAGLDGAIFTGSISGTTLTVSSVNSGAIKNNMVLTSSGTIVSGTAIVSQISGTTGGVGTYQVSQSQNQASATITATGEVEPEVYSTYILIGGGLSTWQQIRRSVSSSHTNNTINHQQRYESGDQFVFTSLNGGSPLVVNKPYYVVNPTNNGNTFQLSETVGGSPIDFSEITSGQGSGLKTDHRATVRNNILRGQSKSVRDGFGTIIGISFAHMIVEGNIFENLAQGCYGDSWKSGSVVIKNNFFKNCRKPIAAQMGLEQYPSIKDIIISENIFEGYGVYGSGLTGNQNVIGGWCCRLTGGINRAIFEKNRVESMDGLEILEALPFFGETTEVIVRDNMFHSQCKNSNPTWGRAKTIEENNVDEFGIQRWSYLWNSESLVVEGATGEQVSFTADASTNIVSTNGTAFREGDFVYLYSLAGGSGLSTDARYFIRDIITESQSEFQRFKLYTTKTGGSSVDITQNYTSGSRISSKECRSGKNLEAALTFAKGAIGYKAGSGNLTPKEFTVFIKPSVYDIENPDVPISGNFPQNLKIVGLGDPKSIVIQSWNANSIWLGYGLVTNVYIKNLTLRGWGPSGIAFSSNGSSGPNFLEDVIFEVGAGGKTVGSGASGFGVGVVLNRCKSSVACFDASLNQGFATNCTFIDCEFSAGIPPQSGGSTFKNCTITNPINLTIGSGFVDGSTITFSGASGNTLVMDGADIYRSKIINGRIQVTSNQSEIYNTTIESNAVQSNSIIATSGSGSVKLFDVGSNKPIASDVTVANIPSVGPTITLTSAPASTPEFIGQQYVNTASGIAYIATGTSSSSDWKALATWNP